MTVDKEKLKAMAECATGFTDMSLAPDVVLDLLAEIEKLEAAKNTVECRFEVSEDTLSTIRGCLREAEIDIDQLKAENEALRKDALRYRWLRDGCGVVEYKAIAGSIGPGMLPSGDKLQAAIDAAMAKEAPHG